MERARMTKQEPDVAATFRNYYNALSAGDMSRLSSLFDDDIVWHQPGNGSLSGTYHGKKEVFELFNQFITRSNQTFAIDRLDDVMVNGDLVCARLHFKAEREGCSMAMDSVDVMRIEGGKVQEVWLFSQDQGEEDRFWSV